jgi:two-component system chemotaxis response regulator CheY
MAKILIVDDSPTLRASAQFTLEAEGHAVIQAETGQAGLSALESLSGSDGGDLKMIITDVNMPEMDGITFIRKVKETQFKYLPILVMTTESQDDKKKEGKEAGAAGWLVKPFKPEQLTEVVSRFVND